MQAYQAGQGQHLSTGIRILLYILSLLIPIAGFIVGAIYYTRSEAEYKHVGKICIILGLVSILITVGLAALLYVMLLGFGGIVDGTPAIQVTRKSSITDGFRIEFSAPTAEVVWSDVSVQLREGSLEAVVWHPGTDDLISPSPPAAHSYGAKNLVDLTVTLNVTDLAGNGRISHGDFITFTTSGETFSPGTVYTLVLIHEPTGGWMTAYDFTA